MHSIQPAPYAGEVYFSMPYVFFHFHLFNKAWQFSVMKEHEDAQLVVYCFGREPTCFSPHDNFFF